MKLFDKYFYNIFIIISISIILRFYLIDKYGDNILEYEWKTLFYNLKDNGTLSFRTFNGELIPSVYMPPLYIYFIYIVDFFIFKNANLVKSIIICQIFISIVSIYFFYKINLFFFSKKMSLFSTCFFSFFPINIYSCLQISSITIQILLNIVFLYLILKIIKKNNNYKQIFILGVISGLTILLRGEFILIFLSTMLFLLIYKKVKLKDIIIIILISLISISPYLTRNYLTFGKLTITKSIGYNLWKGNNIDSIVEGSESLRAFNFDDIDKKINSLPKNKLYDFNYDKIFLESSIKFIKNDPVLFIERYIKKFLTFTFLNLDSNYPNYNNLLNILPLCMVGILFICSLIFSYKNDSVFKKYIIFNVFLTIAIFSIFFILPRYKLIILPIQIIIANFFIIKCLIYKKIK